MESVSLGQWFGIKVYLHWSWVFYIGLIAFFAPKVALPILAIFGIVLLHELGHCFAAKYFNWEVFQITLYPLGGAAALRFSNDAFEEFVVTLCGPLVNAALIGPFYLLGNPMLIQFNYTILLFNILAPAFPCDGGRLLRSVLQMIIKNRLSATRIAVKIGQVTCIAGFIFGICYQHLMISFIAIFMMMQAHAELKMEELAHSSGLANIEDLQKKIASLDLGER